MLAYFTSLFSCSFISFSRHGKSSPPLSKQEPPSDNSLPEKSEQLMTPTHTTWHNIFTAFCSIVVSHIHFLYRGSVTTATTSPSPYGYPHSSQRIFIDVISDAAQSYDQYKHQKTEYFYKQFFHCRVYIFFANIGKISFDRLSNLFNLHELTCLIECYNYNN